MIPGLDEAAAVVHAGGIVAYPTEGVYGLGCDPSNEEAVMRILRLKQRDTSLGVLLLAASFEQLAPFIAPFTADVAARVLPTWPGPETWVVPASEHASVWLRGAHAGIAVRVTAHAPAAALCRTAGMPLVSTSANRHGQAPARTVEEVRAAFGDEVDCIVDAPCGGAAGPTRIRDALTGAVLRAS
ncbi:MAG: Sua5/YciO/YrdC/YwlC family protein [Xanthomonadaceae bacterium]|nr:Sua5/YciO/YrdC/YwlC family protein [Xanthomonadaceae bacterium]